MHTLFVIIIKRLGKVCIYMDKQHNISEYISNLTFKKKFFRGLNPDHVYEVVCEISSMYNALLSDAYTENEQLKSLVEELGGSWPLEEISEEEKQRRRNLDILFSGDEDEHTLTENELRKFKRVELLELLLAQAKRNDKQKEQMKELAQDYEKEIQRQEKELQLMKEKLDNKKIIIDKAGTLAEASLQLNGVFEAAQHAAQQYLDNLQDLYEREEANTVVKEQQSADRCAAMEQATKERCELMKEEALQLCTKMEEDARFRCEEREKESEERCSALDQKAKADVEKRWDDLSTRLEDFYRAHQGLRELLTVNGEIQR